MQSILSTHKQKLPTLIISGASGLQIDKKHDLKWSTPGLKRSRDKHSDVRRQIEACYGPHVGSYKNKLFKRFLYQTKHPIVIFVDSTKIDCKIDVDTCHFVLDEALTWEAFCRDHPLAFGIGCDEKELKHWTDQFESLGFSVIKGRPHNSETGLIARNTVFMRKFERPVKFRP